MSRSKSLSNIFALFALLVSLIASAIVIMPVSAADTIGPTVSVQKSDLQSDPTNDSTINFTATFNEPIDLSTFTVSDVTLGGTAGGTKTAVISQVAPNDDTTFNIAVSGMTGSGTVTASIPAGVVTDLAGNPNSNSTSGVSYDGATLIHQFDFNGNLADTLNPGVSLQVYPTSTVNGFTDGAWWWQGAPSIGGGLTLDSNLLTDPQNYSLGFRISYQQVGPGYKKIISFLGSVNDNGLYFLASNLNFYPFGSNTAITYQPNTYYDFIFSRSSDVVNGKWIRVYIVDQDGQVTKVYESADSTDQTVPINISGSFQFIFFADDTATSSEYTTGGSVQILRVWNGPITEAAVGGALSDQATVNYDGIAPTITITNPDTSPALSKTITAGVSDGTLTMANTTGSVCDGTLTFGAYSSQTFASESDNGEKVCYKAVDSVGNTSYSLSNAIAGIDTTGPLITITNPDTSPALSKTITASVSDGTLTMANTTGSVCDGTLTFGAYSSQTFVSESDNGGKVCYQAVDTLGNTSYSLSNAIAGIDTTSPAIILDGGVVGEPGALEILDTQTYQSHFTSFIVTFNADVNNPADTDPFDPDDVNNPANYQLVTTGTDGEFNSEGCGYLSGDIQIPTGPVVYDNHAGIGPFAATVTVNGGVPLPSGLYRLYICGSTSITDLAGNELNGGIDVALNFRITDPAKALPATGFAPDRVTVLPPQTVSYAPIGDLWLEIPKLGVQMNIVGVPLVNGEWNVSWLGQDAGWLNGSAFPTWAGNSVLTGHVWNADNTAGPFRYINTLRYGDKFIIHAWGGQYVYEVRSVTQVESVNTDAMLKHETLPWVTLVTCSGYDAASNSYRYRVLVRAVLVDVK